MKFLPFAAPVCAVLVACAGAGCATTQNPAANPAPAPASGAAADSLFHLLDTNRDGKISRAEFSAGFADAIFTVYNQPREGSVTQAQWDAIEGGTARRAHSSFKTLDTNNDGKLSRAELSSGPQREAVVNRFFDRIDRNHDGFISIEEGRPAGLDRSPEQRAGGTGL